MPLVQRAYRAEHFGDSIGEDAARCWAGGRCVGVREVYMFLFVGRATRAQEGRWALISVQRMS